MTYGINVRPYNDPYIKIAEEAVGSIAELLIPGTFLVDIIPILKYVPEWFPGAKFQRKAAVMRKCCRPGVLGLVCPFYILFFFN